MPFWLSVILEILKLTIPALIVFATVYTILKQYLDGQYKLKMLDFQQSRQEISLPIRLQAYERLTLFCERINIPTLLYNFNSSNMNAAQMKVALMITVQTEFEYNVTQQMYVSPQLWEIISLAKDDVFNSIGIVYEKVAPNSDASTLSRALIRFYNERNLSGPEKALQAIKKEVALLY